MFDLTGKCALVTGATGGIGSAIARRLHAQGAAVGLSGTRTERLDELAAELEDRVAVLPCDLSVSEAVANLIKQSEEAMERVDILVNNAGLTRDNLSMMLKDDDWQKVLDVNLTSAFRLSRAAVRGMMRRRWGRIVNITSVVGVTGNPGQANYAAAKAGMIGMTKSLAAEIATRGVTVNCVAPGIVSTAMTDVLPEEQRQKLLERVPMGRLGEPDEIASSVVYLASDEAAYVTGQTLHINGGMVMI